MRNEGINNLNLAVSGAPAGVNIVFSNNPLITGNISTMTLTVSSAVAAGQYPIVITGSEGTISHTTTLILTVTPRV